MRSDKHLYQIFQAAPQLLLDLLGRSDSSSSTNAQSLRLESVNIKAIERESDAVLFFDLPNKTLLIVEWQFYTDPWIYNRTVVSMAILQEQYQDHQIEGVIVFESAAKDPQTEPWRKVVSSFVLDELLAQLAGRDPDHPLIALFQPLIESNEQKVQSQAARWYNQLVSFPIDDRAKSVMLSVFIDWIMQRLQHLGKSEIEQMVISELTPLEKTKAGKELIEIGYGQGKEQGRQEGRQEGLASGIIVGKIQLMQQQLGLEVTPTETLIALTIESLQATFESLMARTSERNSTR